MNKIYFFKSLDLDYLYRKIDLTNAWRVGDIVTITIAVATNDIVDIY